MKHKLSGPLIMAIGVAATDWDAQIGKELDGTITSWNGKNYLTGYAIKYAEKSSTLNAPVGSTVTVTKETKIALDGDMDAHLETARRVFETANTLGAKYIRMFSFYLPEGKTREECRGQVFDEMCIRTLTGEKKVRLCLAEIEINGARKQAYFAVNGNMIGREYKILLNGRLMGEAYEMD